MLNGVIKMFHAHPYKEMHVRGSVGLFIPPRITTGTELAILSRDPYTTRQHPKREMKDVRRMISAGNGAGNGALESPTSRATLPGSFFLYEGTILLLDTYRRGDELLLEGSDRRLSRDGPLGAGRLDAGSLQLGSDERGGHDLCIT